MYNAGLAFSGIYHAWKIRGEKTASISGQNVKRHFPVNIHPFSLVFSWTERSRKDIYFEKKIKVFKQICLPERIGILKINSLY